MVLNFGGFPGANPLASNETSAAECVFERIDSCITQLEAQGPSRTCNESQEEEEEEEAPEWCDAPGGLAY